MTNQTDLLKRQYFEWMVSMLVPNFDKRVEYSKLLETLNIVEFTPSMDMDINRLKDGLGLRYRFGMEIAVDRMVVVNYLDVSPCSMLEMMCALSLRIEETIMSDPMVGDRTPFWFGEMINSLGFLDQNDYNFNYNWVMFKLNVFNQRQYDSNGRGGLFTINDVSIDVRNLEIWYQMNLYINQVDSLEKSRTYV